MVQSSSVNALDWIGSAFSIAYFLTPLYQIFSLFKGKLHIKQIPLILLLSILLNCLFWILFGTYRQDVWISMIITNSIGIIVNTVLLFLYLYLLCNEHLGKFIGYSLFVVNLLAQVAYIMLRFVILNDKFDTRDDKGGIDMVGGFGMVMNVFMYASPSISIIDVIKTKQTQFLPIITNVIGFFTAFVWIFHGFYEQRANTMISNAISLLVLLIQIAIWFYFDKKKRREEVKIDDIDKMNQEDFK